jgi:hypothetical protein
MAISERVISQYDGSAKLKAVIDLFESVLRSGIGSPSADLLPEMTIKAQGYWLELLGKRFSMIRPVLPDVETPIFFGLVEGEAGDPTYDTNGKATFAQAPFVPDGQGGGLLGKVLASDEAYGNLISMKVGSLRTDGTQDSVNQILHGAFFGSYVVDNQDMTMSVFIRATGSENDVSIIMNNPDLIPRPVGVGMTVTQYDGIFGFDGNGVGFDQSSFGE